jgi:hypothetical protein
LNAEPLFFMGNFILIFDLGLGASHREKEEGCCELSEALRDEKQNHHNTRSKITVLHQLCNLIPPFLVPRLARETGVDKERERLAPGVTWLPRSLRRWHAVAGSMMSVML